MHTERIHKLDKIYMELEYPEIRNYLQTNYGCHLTRRIYLNDECTIVLKFESEEDFLEFMLEWN